MRLFIAIELPAELKEYLKKLQNQLGGSDSAKMSLVKEFHLTLKFLGDVSEEKLDGIKSRLAAVEFSAFSALLDEIGVFPDEKRPRVVWAGLEPKEKIIELQQKVEEALKGLFPKDERFHPHLTLARVKFVKDKKEFSDKLKAISVDKKEFNISSLKLIKSTLTPEGPVYEELGSFV
ncbi:unnamed protein product [marine sediment metagenome]|uniref:Phosphoesterase HXTX domain-containing protein n=1 Tax=marine sediment metagenome TaxID=412755 RepID=X0U920_9ZZZZ